VTDGRLACHVQQSDRFMWSRACSCSGSSCRARGLGVGGAVESGFAFRGVRPPERLERGRRPVGQV